VSHTIILLYVKGEQDKNTSDPLWPDGWIHHWVLGPYLRNYLQRRALSNRTKAISIILIWVTITYSAFGIVQTGILEIFLLLIGMTLSIRILLYKKQP